MATRMGRHHMNQKDVTRLTVGGRRITYQLKVIQEPERARACGSGAKSSADRRPVDPPPVVDLRIFEGDGPDREDITFGYSANFFLFATLEVARPIANGRMHPPAQQQVPVLTGMPVSGMAYLDRPTEAGYFIFPDLSVRHEGAYKLSFNLYEETKNAEDADAESHEKKPQVPGPPGAPDSSFDWRLEVKSNAFTVYSAKKFPGLSESTTLSRTVAEQGCRVRIRRDVRMRRREGKTTGDYEEAPEDTYSRGRPVEQDPYRSRSNSGTPHGTPESSPNRGGEFSQQYSQYPHPHQSQPGSAGILGFGPSGSQYQNSQPFAAPQAPSHQQYQQPQGAPSYSQQPPPPPPQQQYRAPAPQPTYNHDRQHPQSAFPSHPPREAFEPEPRRASLAFPPSHASREFPPMETSFNRQQPYQPPNYARPRSPPPPSQAPLSLPPIVQSRPLDPKANLTSPLAPVNSIAPFPSESYDRAQERSSSYSYAPQPPALEPPRSGKRPYDSVFKSAAQPLFNGQRPVSSHANDAYDDDEELSLATMKMDYKRANGKFNTRVLPTLD